jgi:hypothetical protein
MKDEGGRMKAEKRSATFAVGPRILHFGLSVSTRRYPKATGSLRFWGGNFFGPALLLPRIIAKPAGQNRIPISSINWKAVCKNSTKLICGWNCSAMPAQ